MYIPAFPQDAKTWKLAALIAMGLFVTLSLFAMLQQRFHPEREQREINSGRREPTRHSLPPEVQRQLQEFPKEK